MADGRDIPPDGRHNPSAWRHRLPVAGLALVGLGIAGYLTLYQTRMVPTVWEPFFDGGSERILNSWVSRLLPIPDAALGMLAYLAEAVTSLIGGPNRWRTRPGIVLLYGTVAGLLGAAGVVLVVLQPTVFGAWCTLCLASASVSVTAAGLAAREVVAALRRWSAGVPPARAAGTAALQNSQRRPSGK